jgi:hypothetical protein
MINHEFDVTYTSPLTATFRLVIPKEDLTKTVYKRSVMGETLNEYWGFSWGVCQQSRAKTQFIVAKTPEELNDLIKEFKADIVRTLSSPSFTYILEVDYISPIAAWVELGIKQTDCDRLTMRDIILLGEKVSSSWGTFRENEYRYQGYKVVVPAPEEMEAALEKLRSEIDAALKAALAPAQPEDEMETHSVFGSPYHIKAEYYEVPGEKEPCRVTLTLHLEREHLKTLRNFRLLNESLGPDWGYPTAHNGLLRNNVDSLWGTTWDDLSSLVTEFRDDVQRILGMAMTPAPTTTTYTIEV